MIRSVSPAKIRAPGRVLRRLVVSLSVASVLPALALPSSAAPEIVDLATFPDEVQMDARALGGSGARAVS